MEIISEQQYIEVMQRVEELERKRFLTFSEDFELEQLMKAVEKWEKREEGFLSH